METITYPRFRVPEPGNAIEIAAGIFWLRLPMPYALNHVNLWLLSNGDSWNVADCGLANKTSRRHWQTIIDRHLDGRPVTRVICTHNHPDHIGLAGWLVRRFGGGIYLTPGEYENLQTLLQNVKNDSFAAAIDFYRAAGLAPDLLDHYGNELKGYLSLIDPLPAEYQLLHDGDRLAIGDCCWQVITGGGHSSEHLCLHCPDRKIFISGDQLLPEISSNVSVWPRQPEADPLREWIATCRRLYQTLDDRTLVLPAHGQPFTGAPKRLATLLDETRKRLEKLLVCCQQPRRLIDMFPDLFSRRITKETLLMACGEARAGCNYLLAAGLLDVDEDKQGILWYRARPDSIPKLNRVLKETP